MMVTIIADASHCPETGAAGYGWWTACGRGKRGGGGQIKEKVDRASAAEMIALVNALHLSVKEGLVQTGDYVLLQTDCLAAISALLSTRTRLSEDEKRAKRAFFELKKKVNFVFTLKHVKGHTNRPEARFVTNNLCDARAKKGMRLARQRLADSQE